MEERLARVLGWLDEMAAGRAAERVPVPGGVAYLHPDYPVAHVQNFLRLASAGTAGPVPPELDAAAVDATADRVLGGAGVDHRVVEVVDLDLAARLDAGLRDRGYQRMTDLILWRPPAPVTGPAAAPVVELGIAERIAVAGLWRRTDNPAWPPEWARQLAERIRTVLPVAEATFLAVRDAEGRVAARADLFRRGGVAQVEEVVTRPDARNRGYATALVREAVRRAGDDLVIIIADADDWPARIYRRLGFRDLGRTALYVRPPRELSA